MSDQNKVELASFIQEYRELPPEAREMMRVIIQSMAGLLLEDVHKIETGQVVMESFGMNMLSMTGARLAILGDIDLMQTYMRNLDPDWKDAVVFSGDREDEK